MLKNLESEKSCIKFAICVIMSKENIKGGKMKIIIGNIVALIASIIMVYSGYLKH